MKGLTTIFFVLLSTLLTAQNFTTWGTEFYIPNNNGYLVIETAQATSFTIEDLALGTSTNYSYPANSTQLINMSVMSPYNSIEPFFSFGIIEDAIRVTSTEPINLRYSFEPSLTGGGSSMILPTDMLGTHYTLSNHRLEGMHEWMQSSLMGMFFVTATENNTEIELNLTEPNANGFPVNTPVSVTLNQGEILQIRGLPCQVDNPVTGCYAGSGELIDKDFSGSTITSKSSCKPISVHHYTGGYFNYIPYYPVGACCSDRMMEQYLPHQYWGNEFYAVPEQHVNHGNLFKVFSRFDNNEVFINGFPITTLNANETFDTLLFTPSYIKTAKQSFVSQYLLSAANNTEVGAGQATDPEIIYVLPIEYRSTAGNFGFPAILFSDPTSEQWLSIVTETSNVGNIILDGTAVPSSAFTPFSSISSFSWAYVSISDADHEIYSNAGSFQSLIIGNCAYGSRVSYVGIDYFEQNTDPLYFAEIICYENEEVTLYTPADGTNVLWSTGETTDSILVTEPGLYSVEATDSCGNLEYSQSYFITYDCDPLIAPELSNPDNCNEEVFEVPNVFTPNGDLINDQFEFEVPSCLSEFQFVILNRWGERVFESTDFQVSWDGYTTGRPATDGTYFWTLQGKDQEGFEFKKTGFLTIVK